MPSPAAGTPGHLGTRTEANAVRAADAPVRVVAQPVVAVLRRGPRTVVELGGDLDITAASPLRERLRGLLRSGTDLLIIDLSGVSSCEVAGLAVLIGIQRWAAAHGISVRLAAPGPQVAELLRVTGLDRILVICATPGDVLIPRRSRRRAAQPIPGTAPARHAQRARLPVPGSDAGFHARA
jgi:anti-anti-sigma factor